VAAVDPESQLAVRLNAERVRVETAAAVAAEQDEFVGGGGITAHEDPPLDRHRGGELQAVGVGNGGTGNAVEVKRLADLAGGVGGAGEQGGVVQPLQVGRGVVGGPPAHQAAGRGDGRGYRAVFEYLQ